MSKKLAHWQQLVSSSFLLYARIDSTDTQATASEASSFCFFFFSFFLNFFYDSCFCNATQTSCHTKRHFGRCRFFSICVIINYMKLTCFFFFVVTNWIKMRRKIKRERERDTAKMQLNAIMQKARSSTHIYLYMGSCRPMLTYGGSRITINIATLTALI